jgi:hypothetical protein
VVKYLLAQNKYVFQFSVLSQIEVMQNQLNQGDFFVLFLYNISLIGLSIEANSSTFPCSFCKPRLTGVWLIPTCSTIQTKKRILSFFAACVI